MFHANSSQKRVAVVKETSDKIDFRPKSIREKRRIVYINKRINFQEDMTSIIILNKANNKSPKYVELILRDLREKVCSTILLGDFNAPFSINVFLLIEKDRKSGRK